MTENLARYIDHTLLSPQATKADITKLCQEAIENKFFAVCVNPCFVRQAVKELASSEVAVATVIGFPLGANLTDIKIAETQRAVAEGAEEIDMVINVGALKAGDLDYVTDEIAAVVKAAKGLPVKVIIESIVVEIVVEILVVILVAVAASTPFSPLSGRTSSPSVPLPVLLPLSGEHSKHDSAPAASGRGPTTEAAKTHYMHART